MIRNSYLHIPEFFRREKRNDIIYNIDTEDEEKYLYWGIYPSYGTEGILDYYTIPIDHQESVSISKNYEYSDLSISVSLVSLSLFNLFLKGGNRVLVFVDFDNIPRTPFISSSNRILTTNTFKVNLTLKPFNCYRLEDSNQKPVSEYVSHKILLDEKNEFNLKFDPPYPLLIRKKIEGTEDEYKDGQEEGSIIGFDEEE